MAEYPPFVNAYGGIPTLFQKIKAAAVPPKFNIDFLSTILDLKSSSFRAMIPLLKKLGFLDQANVPTQAYRDFREDSSSGAVMAERIRDAYKTLFQANEYAYKLEKPALTSKLRSLTGVAEDDPYISAVVGTFSALSALAQWDGTAAKKKDTVKDGKEIKLGDDFDKEKPGQRRDPDFGEGKLRLSYTINLNLPATTEIEVFNAIFKSLKENMLRES
jgi:Family of unknown function (DUF5343)